MSKMIYGAVVSALVLASLPAVAQTTAPAAAPAATPVAKVTIPGGVFYKGLGPQQYAARDRLIGANVVNKDGVVIGDIKDLILNQTNEIEGVILGTGGILGAGEKEVGVRYNALNFSKKDGKTVISLPQASKEVVAALEPYGRTRKSLLERAQDKARALADKTKEGAGPAFDKAKELTKGAVEKAKELGQTAVDKTKGAVEAAKEKAAPQTAPAAPKQ